MDFNIRAGNSLVGFASLDDVKGSMEGDWIKLQSLPMIEERALATDQIFQRFREMQTEHNMSEDTLSATKKELHHHLDELREKLNRYLASEYGIDQSNIPDDTKYEEKFVQWYTSHQPFHWFAEFYGIMSRGGFDVIIGNPPYVEYNKVKGEYEIRGYTTLSCTNLWAFVLEKCEALAGNSSRLSLIVPLSLISAEKMAPALRLLDSQGEFTSLLALSGDAHPSVLFHGVRMSFTILTHKTGSSNCPLVVVSKLYRWLADERDHLFPCMEYTEIPQHRPFSLSPKVAGRDGARIFDKIMAKTEKIRSHVLDQSSYRMLYHRIVRHFVKCLINTPYFWNERDGRKKSEDYKELFFENQSIVEIFRSVLLSSTYYCFFFLVLSDSYHCGRDLILEFPVDVSKMKDSVVDKLREFGIMHEQDIFKNSVRRRIKYKATGRIEYDEFYPRLSKSIIDEIDSVLAQHYGFTDEELDFIINYDIKYRMGRGSDDSDTD